jgi:hypothetical protein
MIVNAVRTVDKLDFFHKLKGLRAFQPVAQALFLDGSKTGQKIGVRVTRQFRTFDPVDIHRLVHRCRQCFACQGDFVPPACSEGVARRPGRRRCAGRSVSAVGVGKFFAASWSRCLSSGRKRRGGSRRCRHVSMSSNATVGKMIPGCVHESVFEREANRNGRSR